MTDPQVGMLMLGLFIFIIMLGFPIAFTLIAMGVGFGFYAYYTPGQDIFANRIFTLLVQKACWWRCRCFCLWVTWSSELTFSIDCSIPCRFR
jgi:hypothetical protein